ncbi:uncharacterized protein A4U43_C03F25600 [Asparagus officinalis]|uniref:Uncharacterized protein n=1 Tax=Asparagus officinalis TaxID=4686 RepID=A0A5P1FI39_ASPOF|nr:protein DROOPING LEAF-like [Asparagus officinalis]ONK76250.1 uncharacterized protein A4U43_C03F25600 [Asparagus officinalis]
MDLFSPSEHLCYVHCAYCNTVLAVGVPSKRLMETVTVKCGHCNHLSFLSPRPPWVQTHCTSDLHLELFQDPCNDCRKSQSSASSSSSSGDQTNSNVPFVVKPPEKKHRLPSAYNRFMKEEIQRIKAANPEIPHREAFSMASKNWAKCEPRTTVLTADNNVTAVRPSGLQPKSVGDGFAGESFNLFREMERN